MKRLEQLFGGRAPAVLRMDPRDRLLGWRENLLRDVGALTDEAFHIRKEPLSRAEAKARDAEFDGLETERRLDALYGAVMALRAELDAIERTCDRLLAKARDGPPTQENDADLVRTRVAKDTSQQTKPLATARGSP